ncbi:unnamed protein product [Didymodactylos carnosus]|uniref:Uncharacterized protein n=1 Tax=Didymodactylos carnosus TaxID=1234261 RepID=A0A813SE19_9BILA|nr:unnamed protein product [Didymodactylos carnosus]CAF3579865.1 unnamed protein product [Didymodactylos carnosus]
MGSALYERFHQTIKIKSAMNALLVNIFGMIFVYLTVIATVYCIDLHGETLTKEELIALTRDHLGRQDPDALLNGFFPVWATIQFCLACFFFVMAILSFTCYILGCRTPQEDQIKRAN